MHNDVREREFQFNLGPGLGPLTKIQEPFVFKDGFRSRQYCVEECLDYCALKVNKDVAFGRTADSVEIKVFSSKSSSHLNRRRRRRDCELMID